MTSRPVHNSRQRHTEREGEEGVGIRQQEMESMEKNEDKAATADRPAYKYRGIKAMPFVIGNETFEKLGTIGTASNLLVYLTTVFNMKAITAATLINTFNGTTTFSPLLGAFLCDTYVGRYKTLGVASIFSFVGMLVLTLTAAIPTLHPPNCDEESAGCSGPAPWQMAFLLTSFALLVVGAGGIRPCNLAFGADQFDPNTDSGKKGITSFFNWYYFTYTFAMMVSLTLVVYVQSNVSWALGLGIPTLLMFLSCTFFFVGTKLYVKVRPEGSPVAGVLQVIVAAYKKRHLKLPEQPSLSLYNHIPTTSINSRIPHTYQFRFVEKAAIRTQDDELNPDGSPQNPRRLSSLQKVEEVKCIIRVIPVWLAGVIYFVAMAQQQTYVVFQALQSDRRVGEGGFKIPGASYIAFTMLTLTIWIPIYDRLVVPFLRRFTGKEGGITILQKIGIGFGLAVPTMAVSAFVEQRRRHLALSHPTLGIEPRRGGISSQSGLWLLAQLGLSGLSEGFAVVGLTEFYYKQFPENMRSISAAFFLAGVSCSNYLSGLLVSVVHRVTNRSGKNWLAEDLNQGRLDNFYLMVAGLEAFNMAYFLVCAKWYKYKGSGGGCSASTVDEVLPPLPMEELGTSEKQKAGRPIPL